MDEKKKSDTMQRKLIPKENSNAKVNLQSKLLKVIFGMFGLPDLTFTGRHYLHSF